MGNMITIPAVSGGFSSPTTRSVRALSLLCEADRTANQLIYPQDFVLKFTQLGHHKRERGTTSMIMTPMMGTNVLRAWLAPLASSLALIWSAERDAVAEERYYDDDETACHLYAEISTSCTGGERAASKVALETSLCDRDNGATISRQFQVTSLQCKGDVCDPEKQFSGCCQKVDEMTEHSGLERDLLHLV